ncbi:hypothetical protein ABPG72_002656 [Tetrahymena utriculariae]
MPMLYSMLMQSYGIFYFVSELDPNGLIKQQNGENYGAVNGQVQSIFSQINSKYLDQLNQIKDQNVLQLYTTILVTFFCLMSLVPSYILTKNQQQKILELFATFDRQYLKDILMDLSYQLQFCKQIKGNKKFDKSNSSYSTLEEAKISKINRQTPIYIEKKLNISRTSSLKYSLRLFIFGLIVIFCLICIYPILNYILVSKFIDNSTIIFNFNSAVCQTSYDIYNSLRNRQGLATAFLIPFWQSIPISTFQNNLNQTTDQILSLPKLIKENLESVSKGNMYNQKIFKDYLINIYSSQACDTMSNYTQYQNGNFQYSQCNSVGNGSLQKGLLNGIVFFINIYQDFFSFAFAQNASSFQQGFNMYNQNMPAYDQFILKIELQKAHESLMHFFQDQNLQLYNYYENITIISATIQISFVILVFAISWYSYFQNVNTQYQDIIKKLSLNFIELNEICLLMKHKEDRSILKDSIINQLKCNSNDESLQNLCLKFDFYLLHKKQLSLFYQKINRQISIKQQYRQFYNKSGCIAFLSLLENSFGVIKMKNANKCFIKTLGFTNKSQIIGQSIFSIFPQKLLQKGLYTKITSQITKNYIHTYNEITDIPLFIARNNQGYSQPFQVSIQSQLTNSQDFGLTIWAKPIHDDNIYIILDYKDPSKIKLTSKTFKQQFMAQNINSQSLKMMRMDSFVPIINDLIKISKVQQNKKFETLLIKYEMSTEVLIKSNLQYPNFLNSLMESQIFVITVSFQIINTKVTSFINMIIQSYKPIVSLSDKIHRINQFQMQIKELCGINLKFDLDPKKKNILKQNDQKFQLESADLLRERESNYIRQKFDNSQYDSTTIIQNIQNATSYYNLSQRNQDIVNTNEQDNSQSNRFLIDTQQNYPDQSQGDYVINLQSPQIQNLVFDQKCYNQRMNDSKFLLDHSKEVSPQYNQRANTDFSQMINSMKKQNDQTKFEINEQNKINQSEDQFSEINNIQAFKRAQKQENDLDSFYKIQKIFSHKQKEVQQGLNYIENSNQQLLSNKLAQKTNCQAHKKYFQQRDAETTEKQSRTFFAVEENQIQLNQDAHSVSSSTKSALNKQLFDVIYQRKQIKYLKFVNIFGIISLLVIITITLYEFLQFYLSLSSQRENFKFINWIYMVNVQLSYALSERNIILLNQNNLLSTPASLNQTFVELLVQQNESRINLSKQYLLLLYNNTNPEIQVFNIIKNQQILQNILYSKLQSSSYKMPMLYSIVVQTYGIFYFVSNQDKIGVIKKQNEANYQAINDQVQIIFSQMNEEYVNQLNSIQSQSTFQLYATIFTSFFCLINIIPSYILIKSKQQKILELFATLDRHDLQEILQVLNYQLSFCKGFNEKKELLESNSNIESYLSQNQTNKIVQAAPVHIEKKLNISRTSNLKYSLKYLTIGILIIFCLISIYPLVNYLLINQFIENSSVIFNFNNVVCQTYFFILNSLRARQGLATAFLLPTQQSISVSTFQNMLNQMTVQANQLPDLIQNNLGKISSKNLLNKDIFNDYLVNVYTGNACDTFSNYTQYQNGDFQYNQCTTVGKGSLLKGLLNGVIFFISIYKDYMTFALSQNATQFQQSFNKYNKNIPAAKQFQFKVELSKDHEYLLNFFQDQNFQLYSYHEYIATILIMQSYQFLIALPSFYISMQSYQQVLSLINIIITLAIGSLLVTLDYGYSFENKDILQKKDSRFNTIEFCLDFILSVNSSFFYIYMIVAFSFVLNAIKLLITVKNHNYLNKSFCRWQIMLAIFRDLFPISLIAYSLNKSQKDISLLIAIIIILLSFKIGDNLSGGQITEQDDQKTEKENVQIIFNLKIIKNIIKIYLEAIELKGGKDTLDTLDFSYLTLVSTMYQNQCLSIIKLLNTSLNASIRLSWKDQQKIDHIMRCANTSIEIKQDQKIKEIQRKYFECLKSYQIIVQKLSVNFIDINVAFQLMIQYREQRNLLRNEIISQIEYNSNNSVLKNLCIKFDLYLIHQQYLSLYQKKMNRQKGAQQKFASIQSEQCCLFISLLENQFGIVKNANKCFMKVLGFTNKSQVIGQPILSIFPQNLIQKRLYYKIIPQINEKYIPKFHQTIEMPLVIAKNNNGYSQPFQVQFQSQMVNSDDFGLTILANPIQDNKIYLILDQKDPPKIKLMSKTFQQLFDLIYQKKQSGLLKCVNILGLASLLVIITITLYEFLIYFVSLSSQRENFKFINWIYMVNVQFSYALSGINTYLLNQNKLYLTPEQYNLKFKQLLNYQIQLRTNLSKQYLLLLYNNTNPNIQVFNIIHNQYISQNIYYNSSHYDQYNMSMIYSMAMQTYGIYYFVSNQDPSGIVKKQNEENYQELNSQVQIIFSQMNGQYINQLNSLQDQSVFQLYSTIFVSLFSLLTVIPGYVLIKGKQQKILELFATFDRQNLQEILSELTYQLFFCKGFDEKNQLLDSKSILQSQANQKDLLATVGVPVNIEKKLNISRTSNLQYSLKQFILGLICIFCLISVYPLVNYVLINRFTDDSQLIFNFNNVVCQSYFFILNSIRTIQGLAQAFLLPTQQSISVMTLQDSLNQMIQQADQLPSLIQENIGKVGSKNIFNKELFKNYLIKVYSENACNIMQNYTQYQNGDFLYDQCSTVGKGNLQRGLLNGVVFFISVFNEFMNFAFSQNATQFQQSFNQFYLNTPAYKQLQFRIELSKAHEYLMNFFQDQNLQLYNYYENISIILVVVQILFVVLVFTICWYFYFKKLNYLITQTRQLLDVFPHKTILKNTYIMSYLRQNQ